MRSPLSTAAVLLTIVTVAASAHGTEAIAGPIAAPLPSKDIRWSLEVGGTFDLGSLPHAAPGAMLGFDVRRGALGFHAAASAFPPQTASGASVGLFDGLASICALAPIGARFDLGACGGVGAGLLYADSGLGSALRPEGLAITRFDIVLVPGLLLSLEAGTVIDPLRTRVGDEDRSSLFALRGSLGVLVRLW